MGEGGGDEEELLLDQRQRLHLELLRLCSPAPNAQHTAPRAKQPGREEVVSLGAGVVVVVGVWREWRVVE